MPYSELLIAELTLFAAATCWLASRPSRRPALLVAVAALMLTATAAWAWNLERQREMASLASLQVQTPRPRDGAEFVSSDACRSCHPSQYASWHRTYHRTMTQEATPEAVQAPFDGQTLESRGRVYHLERREDEFWVEMIDPDWERLNRLKGVDISRLPDPPRAERRVVMITGSHHMQTFWVGSRFGNELINLPFVYLFEASRWVPREDVFLRPPSFEPFLDLWNDNCLECHTTAGIPGLTPRSDAFDTRVAELGISCEACHGPAVEHVKANRNPLRRYRYHLGSEPDPTVVQPAHLDHERSSEVCGQCHSVGLSDARDWLAEGHEYRAGEDLDASRFMVLPAQKADHPRLKSLVENEPMALDARFWNDGQVRVSGREYTGMVESPCFKRGGLSCLSCHSMHDSDPNDQLLTGMGGDQACLGCHGELRGKIAEHTRHPVESGGSRCYDCHMPHTTYGLLTAIRSHTIDSPRVADTLETGRPNACNLCHLDQTLAWTGEHLNRWYGQPRPSLLGEEATVSAAVLALLEGDAGQRALIAWNMGWEPAQEASGRGWLAPYLGHLLNDPYAAVRFVAARSLRGLPGYADFEYDYIGDPGERARARGRALDRWLAAPLSALDRRGDAVLINPDGNLQVERIAAFAARRNNRLVALGE